MSGTGPRGDKEVTKSGAFNSTRMSTLTSQSVPGYISNNNPIALHWRFIFEDVMRYAAKSWQLSSFNLQFFKGSY